MLIRRFVTLPLALCLLASTAFSAAIYDVSLLVTFEFTPEPAANKFTVNRLAGFTAEQPPPDAGFGEHANSALGATPFGPPTRHEAYVQGNAQGYTDEPAHAQSSARTVQQWDFHNLTGVSGGLPAEVIAVTATIKISGTVYLKAETEDERAETTIKVLFGDAEPYSYGMTIIGPITINEAIRPGTRKLEFALPANSKKSVRLQTITFASADSVVFPDEVPEPPARPEPLVPEPSSALLLTSGMATVAILRRRR
jgi:hypothetical protein